MPAPGPRAPPPLGGAGGREFPTSKLSPARSLAASRPGARGPPPPHPAPPAARREPPGPPAGRGVAVPGAEPACGEGLGRRRAFPTRGPGPRRSPRPHPLLPGLGCRAPPRGGVRGREIPHGASVSARCVCARSCRVRGHPEADSRRGDTHGCGHLVGSGELAHGDPRPLHQRDLAALGPSDRPADPR